MRLRLFHQLFLLIAGSSLLAAMAMALVLSFNLRSGFSEYLKAQDVEQLDGFVATAGASIAAPGSPALREDGSLDIKALMTDLVRRGEVPNAPPPSAGPGPKGGAPRGPSLTELLPVDSRPKRDGAPPGGFAWRLMLFDAKGNQVTGPPPPQGMFRPMMLERPVKVGGKTVATARLLPRRPTPGKVDANFLQSQYRSAALITLFLLALAAIPALLIARVGARRLAEMQKTANEIAQGDLTARVAVSGDDELSAMSRDINSMAENLAVLDNNRRRWLAEISHELRTPLSVLVGELDALKDRVRPLNMGAVRSLSDEAQRLGRIVNDLHSLAMADFPGTSCQFVPCDAIVIVDRLYSRFELSYKDANIDLALEHNGLSSVPVVCDQPRIDQMLANLMTNSLRYTNAPGHARITLSANDHDVCIQIQDSAPSVTDEHLARLFEPLYRVEESRDRASGGSGLGLAVSQTIARAHGGRISVSKSALGGLLVEIILPLNANAG